MTNGIKVGDEVEGFERDGGRMIRFCGKVVEIDDHPLEYGMLKVECLLPTGPEQLWFSSRLAKRRPSPEKESK